MQSHKIGVWEVMNRNLISIALILSLMGCAAALDVQNGVEMRPGEAAAERLFDSGIGQPWVGGNPAYLNSFDRESFVYPSRIWSWRYDPFSYYSYQGKTYHPYYYYPGGSLYPSNYLYTYRNYWYPYTYHSGYWWY